MGEEVKKWEELSGEERDAILRQGLSTALGHIKRLEQELTEVREVLTQMTEDKKSVLVGPNGEYL